MYDQIRFAVLGCGRISSKHGWSIAQLQSHGARIVAACDVVESRVQRFTSEYGGRVYTDYQEMLKQEDIDVVAVCLPSGLHSVIGQEVAKAGKHVLMEKPISLKLEDADDLIRTCEECHVQLCVVLQNRFNPPMQQLHKIISEDRLGKLLLTNVTVRWFRPQSYYDDGWHGTWEMDGGAMMNQCIHHIDAMRWLLGEVDSLTAYTGTLAHNIEVEDTGVAIIKFKNGAMGVIEGSTITYPENLEGSIAIFGTRGSVKVGGTALNRRVIWKVEGEIEEEKTILSNETIDPPTVYGFSHRDQYLEFMTALREGRPSATNGYEARKSLEIVRAIYDSAHNGHEVKF